MNSFPPKYLSLFSLSFCFFLFASFSFSFRSVQKKTQISKLCSAKLLSLSQPSLLQKRWAALLPPGGLQSAALRGRRARSVYPGLLRTSGSSFRILLLRGSCLPLLNPPPVGPGRLHLLRRSAALARLGASWRLLGRKSRVPRGLPKLIKF